MAGVGKTAGRGDLVTLEVTDPQCRGVVDSRDRRWDKRRGDPRVDMPRAEAERALAAGHPETRRYRPTFGFHDADIWGEDGRLRRAPGEETER